MSVTITSFELENVKKIRAVALEPSPTGLTVIGGRNGQGKTSVLDSIAWALGGEKYRPSAAQRDGSVTPPELRVTLSNGITVTRKGAKSALAVTDETGRRGGQKLIDAFIEALAIDLPKFLRMSDKEKADTLLNIVGVQDELDQLDRQEKALYNRRLETGRIRDQKAGHADELPFWDGVPSEEVSAAQLIAQHRDAISQNAQNAEKRRNLAILTGRYETSNSRLEAMKSDMKKLELELSKISEEIYTAQKATKNLTDTDTTALEDQLKDIEATNRKIRDNAEKVRATEEVAALDEEYNGMTVEIENIRVQRRALLDGADLPLPELGVENGALTFAKKPWDCMSGSEQLRAATAIVSKLKPDCGFVLLDGLETMDTKTLREFGEWLEERGMQAIGTRVSTGDECTVIIEDGRVAENAKPETRKWEAGKF